jgi:hypothetical protein
MIPRVPGSRALVVAAALACAAAETPLHGAPPAARAARAAQARLAPGPYTLALRLEHVDGMAAPGSGPAESSVIVAVQGDSVTVAQEDGTLLRGTLHGAALAVSGRGHEAQLALSGQAGPAGAEGRFELRSADGRRASGTFRLVPRAR